LAGVSFFGQIAPVTRCEILGTANPASIPEGSLRHEILTRGAQTRGKTAIIGLAVTLSPGICAVVSDRDYSRL